MNNEELERKATADRRKYIVKRVKQLIQLGRQTYFRKDLTPEELASHSDAEILGQIVSETLRWEPKDIFTAVEEMFEDSNLHSLNTQWQGFLNGTFWLLNTEKLKKVTAVFDDRVEDGGISLHNYLTQNSHLFK